MPGKHYPPVDLWAVAQSVLFANRISLPAGVVPSELTVRLSDGHRVTVPIFDRSYRVTEFSATEKKILAALLEGPAKGDALAKKIGSQNRASIVRPLRALRDAGLVESGDEGYQLTDAGEQAAQDVADG